MTSLSVYLWQAIVAAQIDNYVKYPPRQGCAPSKFGLLCFFFLWHVS